MGDPRKQRKKFVTPAHPWERNRIEEEKSIIKNFGLKNKKEIWRMESILRNFKIQAKDLIKRTDEEAKKQYELLMEKIARIGLLKKGAEVEKILDLKTEDILNRRLQSFVFKQKLARSMKQARQFIVHGHITLNSRVVNVPSYIVKVDEESKITFKEKSALKDPEHPERRKEEKEEKKVKAVKVLKKKTGKVDKKPEKKKGTSKEEAKTEEKKEKPKEK